jgi:hypothetical protein
LLTAAPPRRGWAIDLFNAGLSQQNYLFSSGIATAAEVIAFVRNGTIPSS